MLPAATLRAATITLRCTDQEQHFSIVIDKAALPAILDELGKSFGFEVAGLKHAEQGEPLSTTISGTLPGILRRLLRNWNYMIVYKDEGGVAKVAVLNSAYGAPIPKAPSLPGSQNVSQLDEMSDW